MGSNRAISIWFEVLYRKVEDLLGTLSIELIALIMFLLVNFENDDFFRFATF